MDPQKLLTAECRFIAGAAKADALPKPAFPEIAFIGRSNVGKSSLINALTEKNGMARASQTPGRTQQLNFFLVAERLMLVDLPGYGYAKVAKQQVAEWTDLIVHYMTTRPKLKRVLLLLDARRGLMASDLEMMALLDDAAISYQAVLTKADALTKNQLEAVKASVAEGLSTHAAAHPTIHATSAETKLGLKELRIELAQLLANH